MKILAVADEEDRLLWDYLPENYLKDTDLILSAGDLKPDYLSYLVTMARCPLLYIHGNHDGRYEQRPPEGCDCIDGKLITYRGLRILGLGGSMRYAPGPHQYTEDQMRRRIQRLAPAILCRGGVDILLTHAPAAGLGDEPDSPCHRGFEAFLPLMDRVQPQFLVYGHNHMTYGSASRLLTYNGTTLVNACGKHFFTMDGPLPNKHLRDYRR